MSEKLISLSILERSSCQWNYFQAWRAFACVFTLIHDMASAFFNFYDLDYSI